jgi:hypothetical protein
LREKKEIKDGIWSSYIRAVPLVKGRPRNYPFAGHAVHLRGLA